MRDAHLLRPADRLSSDPDRFDDHGVCLDTATPAGPIPYWFLIAIVAYLTAFGVGVWSLVRWVSTVTEAIGPVAS